MWTNLFGLFWFTMRCLLTLELFFIIDIKNFGKKKKHTMIRRRFGSCYFSYISKVSLLPIHILWDEVVFSASLWCYTQPLMWWEIEEVWVILACCLLLFSLSQDFFSSPEMYILIFIEHIFLIIYILSEYFYTNTSFNWKFIHVNKIYVHNHIQINKYNLTVNEVSLWSQIQKLAIV